MALEERMQQQVKQSDEQLQRGDAQAAFQRVAQGRDRGRRLLAKLSDEKRTTPFADLAFAHYLFTERLHAAAVSSGAQDLFFFSREGQPLKEMFDFYQSLHPEKRQIRSHYLRVSRRSTFLLSLGPVDQESFEVLFRQYRSISVADFLRSLELEEYAAALAAGLGVDIAAFERISPELPEDSLFRVLLQSEDFRRIYEMQREARSAAFARYLASYLGGHDVPARLHVVDVGWKGSIQDNVYHWLQRRYGPAAEVEGFYLGLIATGAMSESNRKTGLLFSNVEGRSKGFYIFSENRSLFEIVLHADHGSARRYRVAADGTVFVLEDEFLEGEMIGARVHPVSSVVMELFRQIAILSAGAQLSDAELLEVAMNKHSRMVFSPTPEELSWIFSVSHRENFGVFEESSFANPNGSPRIWDKCMFTWRVLRRARPSELGFWPWLSIRARGLPGLSAVYLIFRRLQNR